MSQPLTTHLTNLISTLRHNPRNLSRSQALTLSLSLSVPILAVLLPPFITDYHTWSSLGRGGVPTNPFGYLIQVLIKPFSFPKSATTDPSIYSTAKVLSQAGPEFAAKSFLTEEDVPLRKGKRPTVGDYVVPHRQQDQRASEETKDRIRSFIFGFAEKWPQKFHLATSNGERHGDALFLSSPPATASSKEWRNPVAKMQYGEIEHLHEFDGSSHVVLSPKDATLVLERGWGERHKLSGKAFWAGVVLIYAPRDEEEIKIVEGILRAGVRWLSDDAEI